MSEHTPGPWEFDPDNYGVPSSAGHGLLDSNGNSLGVTVEAFDVMRAKYPNAEANARLIATAPEILELLIDSQSYIGDSWRERRDAIIAKATGAAQ